MRSKLLDNGRSHQKDSNMTSNIYILRNTLFLLSNHIGLAEKGVRNLDLNIRKLGMWSGNLGSLSALCKALSTIFVEVR